MPTDVYVGNLPSSATVETLRALFSAHGSVESIALITDRATGHLHGFGFVTMTSGASAAILALHDTVLEGSQLIVRLPRIARRVRGAHLR